MWLFKSGGKTEEKPDDTISVSAPIVIEGRDRKGAKPLTDFIAMLGRNSNVALAAAEGSRLMPYFNALAGFVSRTLAQKGPEEATALQNVSTAEGLCTLFNTVAERTQNTILSDVAIVPSTVLTQGPAAHFFTDQPQFNAQYQLGGFMFNFGFLQVYEGGSESAAKSSTAFPVFVVDNALMSVVARHAPEKMLKGMQSVLSFVNHDMLHHMTMPVLNGTVAKKFTYEGSGFIEGGANPMNAWIDALPKLGNNRLYEDWAQVSHEKALLAPENEAQVLEIKDRVKEYFGELKRIGAEIARDNPRTAHIVVDYFGMVMAHNLTRVFPIEHPMINDAVGFLHDADPNPSSALGCVNDMMDLRTSMKDADMKQLLQQVRQLFAINPDLKSYLDSYRKQGLDILPDSDDQISWKQMKMLQLARISTLDLRPHMVVPVVEGVKHLRDNAGGHMINMLTAASQTFKVAR